MLWFRTHHNCPICKKALTLSNLHDITFKPQEFQVQREGSDVTPTDTAQAQQQFGRNMTKTVIYSEFNTEKMAEIRDIELDGPSYTTKVDTLIRHILWLRQSDPGAKAIVFSQ